MADVVSPEMRSRMMSGIRGKNTKPEMIVRKGLHARGFRYILHDKRLPGKPDLVLPKYRAVIFVHGCFWHGHNCHLFKWPKTRKDFWRQKIERNRFNDKKAAMALSAVDWRIGVVWECAVRSKNPEDLTAIIQSLTSWICSEGKKIEIRGC
ncbi:MAG: very short patch repair endonuclease [Pseudomonadota bacterium]